MKCLLIIASILVANLIPNPGFELTGSWLYVGARRVRSEANTGTWSAELGSATFGTSLSPSDALSISLAQDYELTFWHKTALGTPNASLVVKFSYQAPGGSILLGTITPAESGASWQQVSYTFQAGATSGKPFWSMSELSVGSARWYIDDVSLEAAPVITTTIKNALVTDLQDIDGTGSFTTTIAEVGREPKRFDEARKPGAYIVSADYDSEPEDNTTNSGLATHTFTIQLIIHSNATPNADMDAFFDDVRNAVERSTSNVVGVAGVTKVDVIGSSPTYTDPSIHESIYLREVDIAVEYKYARGSA